MNEVKRGFKKKTIEKTIREKIAEWLKSLPEDLQEPVKSDYIVTGGAICSMLQGDLPNDYDIYLKTPKIAQRLANHYIQKLATTDKVSEIEAKIEEDRVRIVIKSAGIVFDESQSLLDYQYFEQLSPAEMEKYFNKYSDKKNEPYTPALITCNAISLHGDIQIIIRFVGPPEVIHTNYDFVHCTNWFTDQGGLVLNQAALESTMSRELVYIGSLYPICTMFRIKKFIERGWTITAGQMLKIAWDVSNLDLSDIDVLREQLVGVDAAYFNQVISLLKYKEDIDRTYLWEVVNRVFDSNEFDL